MLNAWPLQVPFPDALGGCGLGWGLALWGDGGISLGEWAAERWKPWVPSICELSDETMEPLGKSPISGP